VRKAVIILGAGASASFGLPTLNRLFQDWNAQLYLSQDTFLAPQLKELFWEPRGHTLETSHESLTVEDILTILRDYEKQTYDVPLLLTPDLERFRKSLYILIKKAIYDNKNSQGRHLNQWIDYFESSFYYCSGDAWWNRHNPKVVIPLANWTPSSTHHTLLKLHGGIVAIVLFVVANWQLIYGAQTEHSTSPSRQFVIYGADAKVRGAISGLAEQTLPETVPRVRARGVVSTRW
jgi:hypothetical protein